MTDEKNRVILVVEDDELISKAVVMKIGMFGFKSFVAKTSDEALKILQSEKIDVIWLDHYLLDGTTGLDFVMQIKTNDLWKTIPIFVVSNTANERNIESYMKLGVSNYYIKVNHPIEDIIKDIEKSLN
jgi:DNA-binding response OmpR family regulator